MYQVRKLTPDLKGTFFLNAANLTIESTVFILLHDLIAEI